MRERERSYSERGKPKGAEKEKRECVTQQVGDIGIWTGTILGSPPMLGPGIRQTPDSY